MSLLNTILNNFFKDRGLEQFIEPVREARPEEKRQTKSGIVDIFKQDPETGKQVRLERPENQPLTYGERLGLEAPRNFTKFLDEPQEPKGFNILNSLGPITALGSPLWDKGLDIDLQTGDPVPSPVSGTVEFAGPRGGFGNQVRVRGDDGKSYWLSHLQAPNVKIGQKIKAGQPVGTGGKSGNVIPMAGDGSHLDLTVQEPSGNLLSANAVRDLLNTFG